MGESSFTTDIKKKNLVFFIISRVSNSDISSLKTDSDMHVNLWQ